jgi:hypothetical protein
LGAMAQESRSRRSASFTSNACLACRAAGKGFCRSSRRCERMTMAPCSAIGEQGVTDYIAPTQAAYSTLLENKLDVLGADCTALTPRAAAHNVSAIVLNVSTIARNHSTTAQKVNTSTEADAAQTADAKTEETKSREAKADFARKAEAKKIEPRKVEPRKVETRKEETRKVETRKEETRKEETRKEETRKEETRKLQASKKEALKADDAQTAASEAEATRSKADDAQREASEAEATRSKAAKARFLDERATRAETQKATIAKVRGDDEIASGRKVEETIARAPSPPSAMASATSSVFSAMQRGTGVLMAAVYLVFGFV